MTPLRAAGIAEGHGPLSLDSASGKKFATPRMCLVTKNKAPEVAPMSAISLMTALSGGALLLPFSMAFRAAKLSDLISKRVRVGDWPYQRRSAPELRGLPRL